MSRRSQIAKIYVGRIHGEDFGDSKLDRAKTLGLIGEFSRIFPGECLVCGDQSWRRHSDGCTGCGQPFAAERIPRPSLTRGFSPIALMESW